MLDNLIIVAYAASGPLVALVLALSASFFAWPFWVGVLLWAVFGGVSAIVVFMAIMAHGYSR